MTAATRSLSDWLRWLESGARGGIEMGLGRVRQVAGRMALAPVRTITVAGTNGKGTAAHFTAGLMTQAGLRCGLYTSPHLLVFGERIRIDGEPVDDEGIVAALQAVELARGETALTYFEHVTLAALWLFAHEKLDVQVLEVGLGGRLDAVNIIDAEVGLITSIGLDHTDWLGPTRDHIGAEKAGIARAGRALVLAEPLPPDGLLEALGRIGAKTVRLDLDFHLEAEPDSWCYRDELMELTALPWPRAGGTAALRGIAASMRAAREFGLPPARIEAAARARLPGFSLPGRLDRRGAWMYDVAHNVEAAAELVRELRRLDLGRGQVRCVLGMLSDKPVEGVVSTLAPELAELHACGLPGPRGLSGAELARRARAVAPALIVHEHETVEDALAHCRDGAAPSALTVVTGSFFTVAAAMEGLEAGG